MTRNSKKSYQKSINNIIIDKEKNCYEREFVPDCIESALAFSAGHAGLAAEGQLLNELLNVQILQ